MTNTMTIKAKATVTKARMNAQRVGANLKKAGKAVKAWIAKHEKRLFLCGVGVWLFAAGVVVGALLITYKVGF